MRGTEAVLLAAVGSLALTGCVPVGVMMASMAVDTVLLLRTQKTTTDHIVSTVVDLDCGFNHVFQDGKYCLDTPPPSLIAELNRDEAAEQTKRAVLAAQAPLPPIVVAARPEPEPTIVEESRPAPVPERSRTVRAKPAVKAVATAPAAPPAANGPLVVVVGSYLNRDEAERRLARFSRSNGEIVEATIGGRLFHRAVLHADSRANALRALKEIRSDGIPDAWLLAMPTGEPVPKEDRVQTAEMPGAF